MSNKTKTILKAISVILVLLCVAMNLQWIIIPSMSGYVFWTVIAAYGLLLVATK